MIGLLTKPCHIDQVIGQDISGTLVLLNIPNGQYYSLNELGGRVWALCDGIRTVSDIIDLIRDEYEAPVERIQDDVMALLRELAEEHLVDVGDRVAQGR
jgi:hypothetical protein